MGFEEEMISLIQKYLREVKGKEYSVAEIYSRPRWKRVYYWWKALEHYEGKPMPDFTIDEIKSIYGND